MSSGRGREKGKRNKNKAGEGWGKEEKGTGRGTRTGGRRKKEPRVKEANLKNRTGKSGEGGAWPEDHGVK